MLLRDRFWLWGHPEGRYNLNADNFGVKEGIAGACHAADTGVQTRTVAAGGQDADASFHERLPPADVFPIMGYFDIY